MPSLSRDRSKPGHSPKSGQIVKCRGGIWRFIQESEGFWELELVKQGASFAETPVRVWALPVLESESIEVLDEDQSLCPHPTQEQVQEGRLLRPALAAFRAKTLQSDDRAKEASTALSCAIDHKNWQFEPWRRIVDQLPFPRLLIADDVGLGKTTEAAIILAELSKRRRADRVMIVAPQHLCEKWQDELFNRFGLMFEIFDRDTRERLADRGVTNPWEVVERVIVSRDFVKRWENFKPLSHVSWDVVVIDECHHFVRDDSGFSTRLRDFAEKIALKSPGLILMSATPFTGSKGEFRSLIALLDPQFADESSSWKASSPYMIRRLKRDVKSKAEVFPDRMLSTIKIEDSDLSKAERACFQAVHELLEAQARNAGAETWRHLQVETLRKRLSSSWQALHETCSGGEISKWFDSTLAQKISDLIAKNDSAKMRKVGEYLTSLHQADRKRKVVVFTEAIASQDALEAYLTQVCGYAAAEEVRVIHGQTAREERIEIEEDFANPESKLLILIATDTIAEGKDLQHSCHHLVHFELPWSLVKIEQRNGRIDRLGQKNPPQIANAVLDLTFTPDQRILSRLSDKMSQAQESLGSISPILENDHLRFSDLLQTETDSSKDIDVDKIRQQYQELGIEVGPQTPLNAAPLNHRDDSRERRAFLDLMLNKLGGGLVPNGKNESEDLIWLPEERWPLPKILLDAHGYPTRERPWRVTFSAKHFLAYEKYLITGIEGGKPLQFMSPIHPVVQFAETRFRFLVSRTGYPVFSVRGAPSTYSLVTEFTLRSPSGRVITQSLEFLDLKNLDLQDPSSFGDMKPGPKDLRLPSKEIWNSVSTGIKSKLRKFEKSFVETFVRRKEELLKEHRSFNPDLPGMEARKAWIDELWTVDPLQSQYQILAMIVSGDGK